ncbi:hypothetical protein D3C77_537520 [compost metagenome]
MIKNAELIKANIKGATNLAEHDIITKKTHILYSDAIYIFIYCNYSSLIMDSS